MGIPQHSINAGRAVPNSRDHGQEMLFEAGGAITADAIVYSSAASSGRATVVVADDDSSRAASEGSLWVACHAAASGQQVRCSKYRILNNVNTSAGAVGGSVYLSDDGGWSHTPGDVRVRIGTIISDHASTGAVELAPQASYASETVGGIFVSDEITGGAEVETDHGLGRVPTAAFVVFTELTDAAHDVAAGVHTVTKAIFTCSSGSKYRVIAF